MGLPLDLTNASGNTAEFTIDRIESGSIYVKGDASAYDGGSASAITPALFSARAGFVDVEVGGTFDGPLTASIGADLVNPDNPNYNRIYLPALAGHIRNNPGQLVSTPSIYDDGGTIVFTLTSPDPPKVDPLLPVCEENPIPYVSVTLEDLGNPFATKTIYTGTDLFVAFHENTSQLTLSENQTEWLATGRLVTLEFDEERLDAEIVTFSFDSTSGNTNIDLRIIDDLRYNTVTQTYDLTAAIVSAPIRPTIATDNNLGSICLWKLISFDDIANAFGLVGDYLGFSQNADFMTEPLPLINVGLSEIFDFAEPFREAVEALISDPAGSTQTLEDKLNDIFGLSEEGTAGPFGFAGSISLSLIKPDGSCISCPLDPNDSSLDLFLRISLNLTSTYSDSLKMDLDLGEANLAGAADLDLDAELALNVYFDIDLLHPGEVSLVYDETGGDKTALTGTMTVGSDNIGFRTFYEGFGLQIIGGNAKIEGMIVDGDPPKPVFKAHLNSELFNEGRLLLGIGQEEGDAPIQINPHNDGARNLTGGDLVYQFTGRVDADLPVEIVAKFGNIPVGSFTVGGNFTGVNFSGIQITPPNFDGISVPDMSLLDQMLLAVDGVDFLLAGIQDGLDGQLAGFTIPLIGDQFASGVTFIEDFRQDFVAPFRAEVENLNNPADNIISELLYDLLYKKLEMLLPLGTADNPEVSNYIELDTNINNPEIPLNQNYMQWNMTLGGVIADFGLGFDFDLGIPEEVFSLDIEGDLNMQLGWSLDFGFGLDFEHGFYFDIGGQDELQFTLLVDIPDEISGSVGFLEATIKDNGEGVWDEEELIEEEGTDYWDMKVAFAVDLRNKTNHADVRLGFAELGSLELVPKVGTEADLKLGLELGILVLDSDSPSDPLLTTTLDLEWSLYGAHYNSQGTVGDAKVFAPVPRRVNEIKGDLTISGQGGNGSLSGLADPILLPRENNKKPAIGNVHQASGNIVTVKLDDLETFLDYINSAEDIDSLRDKAIEIISGLGSAQIPSFRIIDEVALDDGDPGLVILTLNSEWDVTPTVESRYRITTQSRNFFVNETEQADIVNVHNEDSVADDKTYLTESTITGLGMSTGVTIYYDDLEELNLYLGLGNDTVDVLNTDLNTITNIYASAGDDWVTLADGVRTRGVYEGGSGIDTIDYSLWAVGIEANLTTGRATGFYDGYDGGGKEPGKRCRWRRGRYNHR